MTLISKFLNCAQKLCKDSGEYMTLMKDVRKVEEKENVCGVRVSHVS